MQAAPTNQQIGTRKKSKPQHFTTKTGTKQGQGNIQNILPFSCSCVLHILRWEGKRPQACTHRKTHENRQAIRNLLQDSARKCSKAPKKYGKVQSA